MTSLVPALNVLATALSDSSYAILAGALLAGGWLRATTRLTQLRATAAITVPDLRLRRLEALCLIVLVACHLAHPWFVASSMSGSTRFGDTLALVPTILSSTRQGALWYSNSVALAVLFVSLAFKVNWPLSARWTGIAALCVLAATKAASSHASEEGDFTLAEVSQFLHILATSVWAGAVVVSGLVVVPRLAGSKSLAELWNYARSLSRSATWALAVLILSGLFTVWHDIHGAIATLWISPWGRTLLVKLAFVGLAALLGSLTRFRCLARPATHRRSKIMTRQLRYEALAMVAILCISSLLANTNPGV